MDLKSTINYQRFFLLIFLIIIIDIAFDYYLPWIKAMYYDSFVMIESSKLHVNDNKFNNIFIIKTLRFLSVILLVLALFHYNKFLANIKTKLFFIKKNSSLLFKISTFIVAYAIINYGLNYFDMERHYFNGGYAVFIALTSYTFGAIFKQAYKNKQENDLTI